MPEPRQRRPLGSSRWVRDSEGLRLNLVLATQPVLSGLPSFADEQSVFLIAETICPNATCLFASAGHGCGDGDWHGRKGLQRVYDQHTYESEMREALELWAARLRDIVTQPPGNVLNFKRHGNPGGRPKVVAEIKDLARKHTDEALETLAAIMRNPKASAAARVSAANALLDRGYGKAPLHITGDSISYVARLPEPCKTAEEWMASVKAERDLLTDQASSKPEAQIEEQTCGGLLLEAKKGFGPVDTR